MDPPPDAVGSQAQQHAQAGDQQSQHPKEPLEQMQPVQGWDTEGSSGAAVAPGRAPSQGDLSTLSQHSPRGELQEAGLGQTGCTVVEGIGGKQHRGWEMEAFPSPDTPK